MCEPKQKKGFVITNGILEFGIRGCHKSQQQTTHITYLKPWHTLSTNTNFRIEKPDRLVATVQANQLIIRW